ncbi:PREDICTED: non-specific lipid-transfer protein AP10 isoform X1 [Theobroma cacao]|uniref:Non-specific lipid-transfer protein n=2 Tax=Theobroma cacao TaxID=3641 RepID=A0AB32V2J3_THECC|nr:PREDICTED: non-specific lipid-transfer protein AP10 isoform X1 [Theobroma cacao]EOY28844.1 Nonspecific lipid-transfer protein, putative [Theobroma cacao]
MEKKLMSLSWSLGVLGLVVLFAAASSVHAITCQDAIMALMPCQKFLTGFAYKPCALCCKAMANVNAAANTTQERRDLCTCFQQAGPALGVMPDKAKQLPQFCGLTVSVPMDPNIDCSTVN